jgi:hypothetical protein
MFHRVMTACWLAILTPGASTAFGQVMIFYTVVPT